MLRAPGYPLSSWRPRLAGWKAILVAAAVVVLGRGGVEGAEGPRPNLLIVTVDDMNCDSVGAFGCRLPDTTPHIDGFARTALRFDHAHVCVGNCMPSRNVMFSGRYPHNNRVEGFYQVRDPDYPVLTDLLKNAGYFTAIRGKVAHSTPYSPYAWDLVLDQAGGERAHPKDPASYGSSVRLGIAASRAAEKPFCLLINISDPHKPFYGMGRGNRSVADPYRPSRVFTAKEVPLPGFLPDDPVVKQELALYYSTVRRADDCFGQVLAALREAGMTDSTVVIFLSDHGMPLPFAKTQLYHHSTRTPLLVRWPQVTRPGADTEHLVSAVDLLPTLLEIAGAELPAGLDGRSFAPLLRGQKQPDRDRVFKVYNENSGGNRHPMRGVQTRRFGYLFNPWSDGQRRFRTATQGTRTYRRMQELAKTDAEAAARLKLFDYRVLEEFYDYQNDPDALHNLIGDPKYQEEIAAHRALLAEWMRATGDHALNAFLHRDDPQQVQAYLREVEADSAARKKRPPARPGTQTGLLRWAKPQWEGRSTCRAVLSYQLPEKLGEQMLHVTLKDGQQQRIARKVVKIQGAGTIEVPFPLPNAPRLRTIHLAAFVGPEFGRHLQHITTGAIPLP